VSTVRGQSGSTAPPLGRTHLQALWGASAGPEDLATNQTVAGTSWSCAAATRQSGPRMTSGLTEEDLRCNGED